jgi:hypothetical protein
MSPGRTPADATPRSSVASIDVHGLGEVVYIGLAGERRAEWGPAPKTHVDPRR